MLEQRLVAAAATRMIAIVAAMTAATLVAARTTVALTAAVLINRLLGRRTGAVSRSDGRASSDPT